MKYKTELHCHTSEVSPCSSESGAEAIEKYVNNGYSTLVITNHFGTNIIDYHRRDSWRETLDFYFDHVDAVHEIAGDRLCVLTGMEFRLDPTGVNDYLVYGAKREYFYDYPDVSKWDIRTFHDFAAERGMLVIQAHPMRFTMLNIPPDWVDGYEIYNGGSANSHNEVAEAWARCFAEDERFNPIMTSGSDSHYHHVAPTGGILTSEKITSSEMLIDVLKSGNFELLRG